MRVLAFDTSNYTTSAAVYDGAQGYNVSRLLDVAQGSLGLRQSDALFAHIKRLPEIADRLFSHLEDDILCAVGASTRPRSVEGSYMPCFLAGKTQAEVVSSVLKIPFYSFSHQEGHIAASCWGAERMDLMEREHLAWHLSGGTTELLLVKPSGCSVSAEKIGGTTDISAGQLIDRTGKLLGLGFPSGKALDELSKGAVNQDVFHVKTQDTYFSLSGVQNKVAAYADSRPEEIAAYALRCLVGAILKATRNALLKYPQCEVVFAGGVASNSMLREKCTDLPAVFCPPCYATDNAMGTAILTWRMHHGTAGL